MKLDPYIKRWLLAGLVVGMLGNAAAVPLAWPASIGNIATCVLLVIVFFWIALER